MKNLFTNKKDLEAVEEQITDPSYKRLETNSKSKAIHKDSPYVSSHVFDHAMACLVAQSTQAPAKASKPITAPISHKPVATIPKPPTAAQILALPQAARNKLPAAEIKAAHQSCTDKELRLKFYQQNKHILFS